MSAWIVPICVAFLAAGKADPDTAADVVTQRDGKVILGQVAEPSPPGTLHLIVRRGWLEAKHPDVARRWEGEEKPALRRALAQRRARLELWKRERAANPEPNDRITPWIDRQLAQGRGDAPEARSTLMLVTLTRGQVQNVVQRPKSTGRALRLGWRAAFPNVEDMTPNALKDALEGRGFDPGAKTPIGLDSLLPLPVESEAHWLARRAATEVSHDAGLRFLRIQQMVIPEPTRGQGLDAKAALSALPDLTKLLNGDVTDLLPQRLREVAARGRVGALLTGQDMSPDLESATVEITLWVRGPGEQWSRFGSRTATVRSAEVKDDEGKDLEGDPRVQAVFRAIGALGLGDVPADLKRKSLNIGAATRKALGLARGAVEEDLARLALPVEQQGGP